jgi:hypothetical protein
MIKRVTERGRKQTKARKKWNRKKKKRTKCRKEDR